MRQLYMEVQIYMDSKKQKMKLIEQQRKKSKD